MTAFPEGQSDPDRVVLTSSNVQSNLQTLAQDSGKHVCHQIDPQTAALCLTSPRCQGTEHRCIEHLVGGSGRLCLFPVALIPKVIQKLNTCRSRVQNDCRLTQDALVLGPRFTVIKTPTSLISVETTVQSEISSE